MQKILTLQNAKDLKTINSPKIFTAPLRFSQQGVYVECLSNPQSTTYNCPFLFKFPLSITEDELEKAVCKVTDAHSYIFCKFTTNDNNEIIQEPIKNFKFEIKNLEMTSEEFAIYRKKFVRPFDIRKEPFNLYNSQEATYGIKHIAARYVHTLQKYQPTGPYIIGGWCYGGVVAHEMAYQVENAGEKVQHLFMLDSHVITNETVKELAKNMFGETDRNYFETSPLFEDLREKGMLEAVIKNYLHFSQDVVNHRTTFFHGNVTYFKPEELPLNQSEKSLAYWKKMMQFDAGGFENFCDTDRLKITGYSQT